MGYSLKALSIARGDTGTPPYKLEPSGVYTTTKMSDYFITGCSISGGISGDVGSYTISVSISGTGSKISVLQSSSHLNVIPHFSGTASYSYTSITNTSVTIEITNFGTVTSFYVTWHDGYNPDVNSNSIS